MTFAIALISRAMAYDWERVQRTLDGTLAALVAQSDPAWEAVVCGQDRPRGIDLDPRIRFLPFDGTKPRGNISDRLPKHEAIVAALAAETGRDGYLFRLDADDILHPGLVAHFRERAEPGGYLITDGYMMDARSGAIARLAPQSWREPRSILARRAAFHTHCGSSSATRFDRRDGADYRVPLTTFPRHRRRHHALAAFGLDLARVPFPAAIYLVNHGENLRLRRGKGDAKVTYANRHALPPAAAEGVRATFGLGRAGPG